MTEKKTYTIVIKLGSSSLVDEKTKEPKLATMSLIVETVIRLKRQGHRVIIVSSGGIAIGLRTLNQRQQSLFAYHLSQHQIQIHLMY